MTNTFKIALAITGGVVAVEAAISKAYRLGKVKGAEECSKFIKSKKEATEEQREEEKAKELERIMDNIHYSFK